MRQTRFWICLFLLYRSLLSAFSSSSFSARMEFRIANDRNSDICENSFLHIGCAKSSEQQYDCFYAECKDDVLFYDRQCFSGNPLRSMRILRTSSSISTTSAASIAASDPMLPMVMPISALVSTGASLMPSPTNASFSFLVFPSGGVLPVPPYLPAAVPACTSSIPSSFATSIAASLRSPVSMTHF